MLRIIAGTAGGLNLKSPPDGLRPTMDRVRAAIFSSLGDRVIGARTLDLFAGTGAMGLEALSRGAEGCVFVELRRANVHCIEENLRRTKLGSPLTPVVTLDALAWLRRRPPEAEFDIVFADPPYFDPGKQDIDFASKLLASPGLATAMTPDAILVLERNPRAPLKIPSGWEETKARRYGITEIAYLRLGAEEGESSKPQAPRKDEKDEG